jgi:hypothetical protein
MCALRWKSAALLSGSRGYEVDLYAEYVRFEVLTAVTVKNAVFWDIKPSSFF